MKKKFWLPGIATLVLLNLFFIRNISIDDGSTNVFWHDEETDINDLGEDEEIVTCESFVDFEDFEDFLFGLGEKPLHKVSKHQYDTTGDGQTETVIEEVYVENSKCIVKNVILKGGAEIWKNEYVLTADLVDWHFGKDMSEEGLQDYALFYLGIARSAFVQKLEKNSSFDERTKMLSRYYQKDTGLDIASMYQSEFHEYLVNYEGYFVFDRSPGNNSIYIWSEEKNSFIHLYDSNFTPNLI